MGGFTKVNLKEIEDSAGESNPQVEARFARKHIDSEHLGVSFFRYAPGHRSESGHSHTVQEEVYVVVAGSGKAWLDGEIVDLGPWDVLRIAPQTVRALAAGPDGLELIAVGSDRPEAGDGVLAPGPVWQAVDE